MPRTLTYSHINNKTFGELYSILTDIFSSTHASLFVRCPANMSIVDYHRKYAKALAQSLLDLVNDLEVVIPFNLVLVNPHIPHQRTLHLCGPHDCKYKNLPFLPFKHKRWLLKRLSEMEIKLERKK